jgi:dTDP-4-dehydrorhamnose reductase
MKKVMILGAGGRLGAAMAREYSRDYSVVGLTRTEGDLSQPEKVCATIRTERPDTVINCAAMTNVDACESERDAAYLINAQAPGAVAQACAEINARMIHISTDYVFSGMQKEPYRETDEAAPQSWYGETKLAGEQLVAAADNKHVIARVSWVFGPDRDSFIDKALASAWRGDAVKAVADKWSSPTYTVDAARALDAFLKRDEISGGTFHLCNRGVCTWQDWAQAAIDAARIQGCPLQTAQVEPLKLADITAMIARRPVYSAMNCEKLHKITGYSLPNWKDAVASYVSLLIQEGRLPS